MGWQEPRVILLPPGRRLVVEASPRTRTVEGKPVLVLSSQPEADGKAPRNLDMVQPWLEERGFTLQERSSASSRLKWEDVEVFLSAKDGDLSQLDLTFTLSPDSPSRWQVWQTLVHELCATWGFRLADANCCTTVGEDHLFRLLGETMAWQDYQRAFGWPAVASVGK